MSTTNGKNPVSEQGVGVPIKHVFPIGDSSSFVNHLVVQHTEQGEFHISFFEIIHPLLLGDGDIEEKLRKLDSVEAKCVTRIVVSSERLPNFIGALVKNYDEFEKHRSKSNDKSQVKPKGKKNAG